MNDYWEEFEGGVTLEYTSDGEMTDEQREAFMALMPITFEDTLSPDKGSQLNIIFGVGTWTCKTPPQEQKSYPCELIVNGDFATWEDPTPTKPRDWTIDNDE
jgi:hypothetical protein